MMDKVKKTYRLNVETIEQVARMKKELKENGIDFSDANVIQFAVRFLDSNFHLMQIKEWSENNDLYTRRITTNRQD